MPSEKKDENVEIGLCTNGHEKFESLIQERQSFELWCCSFDNTSEAAEILERVIEKAQLTCRLYSKGRLLAASVGVAFPVVGMTALAGIAAHNLMTYNPDYEICRDWANNRVMVEFKRK